MRSTITGLVNHTIVLGTGQYSDTVLVSASGDVAPAQAGSNGIYLPQGAHRGGVINQGAITAAAGTYSATQGGAGGIGIDLAALGHVVNSGTVTGGAGGATNGGTGGQGGAGIVLSAGGGVRNLGDVIGGAGGARQPYGDSGAGGIGVELSAGGSVFNKGSITGGSAGYNGGQGGSGVVLTAGGVVSNQGTISGGVGGYGSGTGNLGGTGVAISAGTLTNDGVVVGGAGGSDNDYYNPGTGGVGAIIRDSVVSNAGTILGGQGGSALHGGGAGGSGVDLGSGSTLTNSGVIRGGYPGSGYYGGGVYGQGPQGVYLSGASTLINTGTIGGNFGYITNGGGAGVDVTGASRVSNGGTISGAIQVGGTGAIVQSGSLDNTGLVTGGSGYPGIYINHSGYAVGGVGGIGIAISSDGSVNDSGRITGGQGGYTLFGGNGGDGGVGVALAGGNLIVSSGAAVTGGQGGEDTNYDNPSYTGGLGGVGVNIIGGSVTNQGTISGGTGGSAYQQGGVGIGGNGGAGVYLDGGTLVTSGTISGGAVGLGLSGNGQAGDAVLFGDQTGTLVVDPGARFNGLVVADANAADVLVLAASTDHPQPTGLLNGLGANFTGFTSVIEQAGAIWDLAGSNALGSATTLSIGGELSVGGTLTDAGSATVLATGTLSTIVNGVAQLASLQLSGGTLYGEIVVGASLAGAQPNVVTVDQGASVIGFGTILDGVADQGTITAQGGTLTVFEGASGTGTAVIDSHAALRIGANSLTIIFAQGGSETLQLSAGQAVGTISGFGTGDVIDIRGVAATSLRFSGDTLSLLKGSKVVETLTLAGSYKAADFHIGPDGAGGTDISFVGKAASTLASEGDALHHAALAPPDVAATVSTLHATIRDGVLQTASGHVPFHPQAF